MRYISTSRSVGRRHDTSQNSHRSEGNTMHPDFDRSEGSTTQQELSLRIRHHPPLPRRTRDPGSRRLEKRRGRRRGCRWRRGADTLSPILIRTTPFSSSRFHHWKSRPENSLCRSLKATIRRDFFEVFSVTVLDKSCCPQVLL